MDFPVTVFFQGVRSAIPIHSNITCNAINTLNRTITLIRAKILNKLL